MKETSTQTLVNTILALSREIMESTRQLDESRRQTKAEQNAYGLLQSQIAARDQLIAELNAKLRTASDNIAFWQKKLGEKDVALDNLKAGLPKLAKLYETASALESECTTIKARSAKIDVMRSELRRALAAAFDYCDQIPF